MKRPNFYDYIPKGTTVKEIQEMFKANEHLYNYIQALDAYIDGLSNTLERSNMEEQYFLIYSELINACVGVTTEKDYKEENHKLINITKEEYYAIQGQDDIDKLFNKYNSNSSICMEKQISSSTQKIIEQLEQERDNWKRECQMYINAWGRELGEVYQKTHTIDALVITTRALKKKLKAFEEVAKTDFR